MTRRGAPRLLTIEGQTVGSWPGFKFKDAELIGFPIRITVGKRGLADGIVEVQTRRTGETQKIAPDQVAPTVKKMVESAVRDERTDDA